MENNMPNSFQKIANVALLVALVTIASTFLSNSLLYGASSSSKTTSELEAANKQLSESLSTTTGSRLDIWLLKSENIEKLDKALKAGANPNIKRNRGMRKARYPLEIAARDPINGGKFISVLLRAEANPLLVNAEGLLPIHIAASRSLNSVISLLSTRREEQLNACRTVSGKTALHEAIRFNQPDIVKYLLQEGADPFIIFKYCLMDFNALELAERQLSIARLDLMDAKNSWENRTENMLNAQNALDRAKLIVPIIENHIKSPQYAQQIETEMRKVPALQNYYPKELFYLITYFFQPEKQSVN